MVISTHLEQVCQRPAAMIPSPFPADRGAGPVESRMDSDFWPSFKIKILLKSNQERSLWEKIFLKLWHCMLGILLERTSLNVVSKFRWMTEPSVCSWAQCHVRVTPLWNRPKVIGGCCNYQLQHIPEHSILFAQSSFLKDKTIYFQTWWHGFLETYMWELIQE